MHCADSPLENDCFVSSMHIRSNWTPPPWGLSPDLQACITSFFKTLQGHHKKRRGKSNLLPHHRTALKTLQTRNDIVIVQCDNNLGLAIMERQTCAETAFRDHLDDAQTYEKLTLFEANVRVGQVLQFCLGSTSMLTKSVTNANST